MYKKNGHMNELSEEGEVSPCAAIGEANTPLPPQSSVPDLDAWMRKHWYISGDVQGVGFRHRAMRAASYLGLTGWVCNMQDGRVELEAQGNRVDLRRLVSMIEESCDIEIVKAEETDIELCPMESSFSVRYGWD